MNRECPDAADLRSALRAVLLFYRPDWTPELQAEWEALTGQNEASTRTLCDMVRAAIGASANQGQGMGMTEQERALAEYLLSPEYRRLLLRAVAARLATTSGHHDAHAQAMRLIQAAYPDISI